MGLLKRITGIFTAPASSGPNTYWITAQCQRCGETVRGRVNMANDLSAEYDEDGKTTGYVCRKVLMGQGRCFQQIEVLLAFDAKRKLRDRQITGGKFVDE